MTDTTIEPVAVIGLGNMGMSVLGALLSRGLSVVAVDRDGGKLDALRRGHSLVPEKGAKAIIRQSLADGRLTVDEGCANAAAWPVSFVAVQTPNDGRQCDYRALRAVLAVLAGRVNDGHLLIVGSTVFPGAIEREVLPILAGGQLDFVYQPVFLRAGFGIDDYLHPGKVILGVRDPEKPPEKLARLAERILTDVPPRFVSYAESEWIKVVHNAFMSMKIAFVNEIALLCAGHPVSPERIVALTLEESTHGRLLTRSHTQPGIPFSGPCLPKDAEVLRGMVEASPHAAALRQCICAALGPSNDGFRTLLVERWLAFARDPGRPLGIIGMSFRPGFNEMRHSLALDFVRAAQARGIEVLAYDPAFESATVEDYRLACRQDNELLTLWPLFRPLEEVWQMSQGLLFNRRLDEGEQRRIARLPRPPAVDLYDNSAAADHYR